MHNELKNLLLIMNPWLKDLTISPRPVSNYITRLQTERLLLPDWDRLWLVLVGPRQAGKTTLGKFIANTLINTKKFKNLLYLNCDFLEIREWLKDPGFISTAIQTFNLENSILFIDEVQRLANPGLLLKGIADLNLPIKMLASGSSQLEIRSTVQEYLTGRHIEALILPLSYQELNHVDNNTVIYGCYPSIVLSDQKEILLQQLYKDYINKDIIEILKLTKPDVMQKLITLIAHSSGQLVNYQQLATDCKVAVATIQNYCDILEKTYTIASIRPFAGNKRKEIVSNPIYYFIDNGFRNQALRNFTSINNRTDVGLLIQNAVFQEILKYRAAMFYDFDIYYWRTQAGAEVDFVLYKNAENFWPIEVKYANFKKPTITRSFRSFLDAYQPKQGFIITRDFSHTMQVNTSQVNFIPFNNLTAMMQCMVI